MTYGRRVRVMTSKRKNENEEEHVNRCPWCGKTEDHSHYKEGCDLEFRWYKCPPKIGETRHYPREEWDVGGWLPKPKNMGWDIYLSPNVRSKQ